MIVPIKFKYVCNDGASDYIIVYCYDDPFFDYHG